VRIGQKGEKKKPRGGWIGGLAESIGREVILKVLEGESRIAVTAVLVTTR
jgi:hypothetical protein